MCYLLSWSMTSPVTRLRQAAQSLAAGDLSARAGAPRGRPSRRINRVDARFRSHGGTDRRAGRFAIAPAERCFSRTAVSAGPAKCGARVGAATRHAGSRAGTRTPLNRIELEADRLNQLIQRLLTISRLESGTDGLRKTTVSLRELVEQVAHDAEYETPGRGCRVTAHIAAGRIRMKKTADEFLVEGDPDLLRSAVENVVRNATRYTAEGTTVEVRLERQQAANGEGEQIIVRVLDSGPGVPDEALPKIFEPFYRLDDARNRQTGGAGLGLSIADRAIRLHGGQLRASNRKEGGLEVEIRIPAGPPFRGLLFPLIPDKQIYFSHKLQSP